MSEVFRRRSAVAGGSFTFPPSNVPTSTEVRSRPAVGPHAPLTVRERTGRKEAAPTPCARFRTMDASDDSTPSEKGVTTAQFDEQEFLSDYATHRVRGIVDDLRYTVVKDDPSAENLRRCVARTRYQLELLETILDDQLGDDDLKLRLIEDWEGMEQ